MVGGVAHVPNGVIAVLLGFILNVRQKGREADFGLARAELIALRIALSCADYQVMWMRQHTEMLVIPGNSNFRPTVLGNRSPLSIDASISQRMRDFGLTRDA